MRPECHSYGVVRCWQLSQTHRRQAWRVAYCKALKTDSNSLLVEDDLGCLDMVQLDMANWVAGAFAELMWKKDLSYEKLQGLLDGLMRLVRAESSYQRICFLIVRRHL